MTPESEKKNLMTVVILSLVIPVAGFVVLDLGLPSQRWIDIPIHTMLETTGLTIGLITAFFLLSNACQKPEDRPIFNWIAAALIGMAILDGFHAAALPGNTAVWFTRYSGSFRRCTVHLLVVGKTDRCEKIPVLRCRGCCPVCDCFRNG